MGKNNYEVKLFNNAKIPSELQFMVDNVQEFQDVLCSRVRSEWREEYRCCRKESIMCKECILDESNLLVFKEWITPAFKKSDNSDLIK